MSDIAVAEIPVDDGEQPLPVLKAPAKNALVEGPILRTLLRLAWPNVIALSAGTCVVIAETSYIGRLGVESLAAMALLFPCVILTMTMSGGAMGGGVASSIARALGAGDIERASALASHALLIGLSFGLDLRGRHGDFRPRLLELLGGRGNVLANAVGYAQIFFGGAVLPWLMNTSAANPARHRQHETAVAGDPQFRGLPDRARRHARPRPRAGAAIRHARRRRGFADRLHDQPVDPVRGICFPAAPASRRRSGDFGSSARCSSTS